MNYELIKEVYKYFKGNWPTNDSDWPYQHMFRHESGGHTIHVVEQPSNVKNDAIYVLENKLPERSRWVEITQKQFDAYGESLKSDQEINWDEAPEGATAYSEWALSNPWLKKNNDGVFFYGEATNRWREYPSTSDGEKDYEKSIKKPQDEPTAWQPKVGEECEAAWGLTPDMWGSAVYIGDYFLFEFEKGKFMKMEIKGLKNLRFRPIKTERDKFVEKALSDVLIPCNLDILKQYLSDLYDAGYRKTEEEK